MRFKTKPSAGLSLNVCWLPHHPAISPATLHHDFASLRPPDITVPTTLSPPSYADPSEGKQSDHPLFHTQQIRFSPWAFARRDHSANFKTLTHHLPKCSEEILFSFGANKDILNKTSSLSQIIKPKIFATIQI